MSDTPTNSEPTIDWLIDEIAPNNGKSPLVNFNKKRLKAQILKHYRSIQSIKKAVQRMVEPKTFNTLNADAGFRIGYNQAIADLYTALGIEEGS